MIIFILLVFYSSTSFANVSCPTGFTLVNQNKCLKQFPNVIKHFDAETNCTGYGGTLVNIHNAIENRAVMDFAFSQNSRYIWLGMYCFGNDTSTCYHDDGSGVITYCNFAPGHPRVDNFYDGCIYTSTFGDDMKWYSINCQLAELTFLCEVPTTVEDPTCIHNFNGYCYLLSQELPISAKNRTYPAARDICHTYNSQLASIHSKREVDFIKSIYKNSTIKQVTLGAQASNQAIYWNDGTYFDYDYSDPLVAKNGSCLVMDTSAKVNSGMWSRTGCQNVENFLCKRKIGDGFRILKSSSFPSTTLLNTSHCNTTLYMAPGMVTSLGYPNPTPSTICSWKLVVLGPYRVGLYFTDFSTASNVEIYDEYGNLLGNPSGNLFPFQKLAPTNIATLVQDSRNSNEKGFRGFSVTVLPY